MNETSNDSTGADDLRLSAYLSRWWQELVRLDGRTWRSFRALLTSPGRLAVDQCDAMVSTGSESPPIHPVRLYLTINILFFLLAPWVSNKNVSILQVEHTEAFEMQPAFEPWLDQEIERLGVEDRLYRAIFDERMNAQQGAVVIVQIPVLGLAGFLVARRRRRFLVEHLVLATNLAAFSLISVLVLGLVGRFTMALEAFWQPISLLTLVGVLAWMFWIPWTIHRSLRIFHELKSRLSSWAFTGWMIVAFLFASWIYLQVLFVWTLVGLRNLSLGAG